MTAKDRQHLTIEYHLPGSESTVREATVNGSDDRVVGRRYPAHVDDDGDVRLDADPYNVVGPIVVARHGVDRRRAGDVAGHPVVA